MIITIENVAEKTTFSNIEVGEVFRIDGDSLNSHFLKVLPIKNDETNETIANCIDLSDYTFEHLYGIDHVVRVHSAELHIKD